MSDIPNHVFIEKIENGFIITYTAKVSPHDTRHFVKDWSSVIDVLKKRGEENE